MWRPSHRRPPRRTEASDKSWRTGRGQLTKKDAEKRTGDFPGGAGVKNPPANAGDVGSSPGPGRSHMPWSN